MDFKTKENLKTKDPSFEKQPEEELKEIEKKEQTPDQKARVTFIEGEVKKMAEMRNQGYKWFGLKDDRTNKQKYLNLIEYINESEKRLNGTLEKPAHKDDWQANIFDNITRDKFISILSRLSAQRMKAQFFNIEGLSTDVAKIVTNLYDAAGRGKNGQGKDEVHLFNSMFEAASKGTTVREETYRLGKRRVKSTKNKDGSWNYKTIYEWEDVWSKIVPIEEFYPGDITKTNIQEMGKCSIVQHPSFESFKVEYSDYEAINSVSPMTEMTSEEKTLFNVDKIPEEGVVRIMKYYNRITDSFDITANGILLTQLGNPLPHPHKQLPFNVARFELLSTNFFYGMSLPFKLVSMQDVTNSIWNMMLDQLYIALMTPIFNASGTEIDIDWLYPKSVIDLPKGADTNAIKEFSTDKNNITVAQNALMIVKRRMDENAASGSEQSGVAGAGRAKTAEEVATAREAAMEIMGLFLKFMEWAEEDRAEQRIQNMLYYYSKPMKSNGQYRKIVVDNVRLLQQELGTMFVNITKTPGLKKH